ncbi:MAG: hypothetical protein ABIT08_07870 [Bacteroidia bacterium]
MDLPKKDKKFAREIIEKGLQEELAKGLCEFDSILHDWKNGSKDHRTAYHSIFKAVKEFDRHIARRYDGVTGSKYFYVIAELLFDGIMSEEYLKDFTAETQQKFKEYLKLAKSKNRKEKII